MHDWEGATPGLTTPKLSMEPLGTEGELSPGPDELRPSVPQERAELERMGFLEQEEPDRPEFVEDDLPPQEPVFDVPQALRTSPLNRFADGPLFE